MKHHSLIRPMILACLLFALLTLGAITSRSQIASQTHTITKVSPVAFYLKIGGLTGPAKGYLNKSIASRGFNNKIQLPDRLKAGTYYIQFVDASGRAYPGLTGSSITITSKPQSAETASIASGNQTQPHQPISITKQIDKVSPLNFTITPGDVDADGMLDVMVMLQHSGVKPNVPVPPAPKN
jgi:hypothetical protein